MRRINGSPIPRSSAAPNERRCSASTPIHGGERANSAAASRNFGRAPYMTCGRPVHDPECGASESGMSTESGALTIDVVSDVVCPWCYLGKKRLEAALAEAPQRVVLRWRPYQLDPTIPGGGL